MTREEAIKAIKNSGYKFFWYGSMDCAETVESAVKEIEEMDDDMWGNPEEIVIMAADSEDCEPSDMVRL